MPENRSMVMYCRKCGKEAIPGAVYCSTCGVELAANGTGRSPQESGVEKEVHGYRPPPVAPIVYSPPAGPVPPLGVPYQPILKNNPYCVAALVLGIMSLIFLFGPVLGAIMGVVGIFLAKAGMEQVDADPGMFTGRDMGKAGLILSIIGVSLNAVFVVLRMVVWGFDLFW